MHVSTQFVTFRLLVSLRVHASHVPDSTNDGGTREYSERISMQECDQKSCPVFQYHYGYCQFYLQMRDHETVVVQSGRLPTSCEFC